MSYYTVYIVTTLMMSLVNPCCAAKSVGLLRCHRMVVCRVFIGQSTGKGKEQGMSQKEQQALLQAFHKGEFNVMVATCIAEEGLDIPQVCSLAKTYLRFVPLRRHIAA